MVMLSLASCDLKGYDVSDNSTLKGVTYLALDLPVTSYTENYALIESYLQLQFYLSLCMSTANNDT